MRGVRQAGVGASTAHPRCSDAGAGHSLACVKLYTELRRIHRRVVVQLLQGVYDGEGLRQQLHQPQLYVSQGSRVCLQWITCICLHDKGSRSR